MSYRRIFGPCVGITSCGNAHGYATGCRGDACYEAYAAYKTTGPAAKSSPPVTWAARAACRGMDPDLFFPARGKSTHEAKAVCRTCEVKGDCLAYALAHGEKFGIWGGRSEKERRRLRSAA